MKLNHILMASLMSAMAVSTASAADMVISTPATPAASYYPYSFEGAYMGLQAGNSWLNQDNTLTPLSNQVVGYSHDIDGFLGGIYLGYNYQFNNNLVASIETDFAFADISGSKQTLNADNSSIYSKLEEKWNGATRVRLGYAFDRFLPYIAGGFTYAQVKNSVAFNEPLGVYNGYSKDTQTGFTIGAGMDYAVTDNILLRLEYRYGDYGSTNISLDEKNTSINTNADYTSNDVRVGVAYKF